MNSFFKREYDYAIRICAFLAGRQSRLPLSLTRIAELLYISKPFATKIMHKLKNAGITATVQGKYGGIYLLADPHNLSLLQILEAMGFDTKINDCLHEEHICPLQGLCKIRCFFDDTNRLLMNRLAAKKISELTFNESELASSLDASYNSNRKELKWMP